MRLRRCFECNKFIRKSPRALSQPYLLACYRKFKNSPDVSGEQRFLCPRCFSKVKNSSRSTASGCTPCTATSARRDVLVMGTQQTQFILDTKHQDNNQLHKEHIHIGSASFVRPKMSDNTIRLKRCIECNNFIRKCPRPLSQPYLLACYRKFKNSSEVSGEQQFLCSRCFSKVKNSSRPTVTGGAACSFVNISKHVLDMGPQQNQLLLDTKHQDNTQQNSGKQKAKVNQKRGKRFPCQDGLSQHKNTYLRRASTGQSDRKNRLLSRTSIQNVRKRRQADNKRKASCRAVVTKRLKTQEREREYKRRIRKHAERKVLEKSKDLARKRNARRSRICKLRESRLKIDERSKKRDEPLSTKLEKFIKASKEGPTYVCSCCGSLWFRTSVQTASQTSLLKKFSPAFVQQVLHVVVEDPWFCQTCYKSVHAGKIPRLALWNGLDFPKIPDVLKDLSTLEERMVALRLPFLQIRSLGVDRQCGLRGNVVHIENDLDSTVTCIPRTTDETSVFPVILVRNMNHEKPYLFQNIRPVKIYNAAKFLLTTPLYMREGATLSSDWLDGIIRTLDELNTTHLNAISPVTEHEDMPDYQETMLMNFGAEAIKIAPGQGKRPMSLLMDLNAEAAAYPSIFCGQLRSMPSNISVHELWKSQTRRYDRRCAVPQIVLHVFKLSQNHQVASSISICLRKKKGTKATAADLLDGAKLNAFITHDFGYRLLKDVRTSPAYWESKTKHMFAMIRQLGIPSLFITLSAAETHWPELIVILKKVLDNESINEEDAITLNYEEKADLIRRDPVTCSRYFDYRLRTAFNLLFKPNNGIFAPYVMKDFYWRIEFQHRGSPHVHMLVWLENAPKFSEKSNDFRSFIDQMISCHVGEDGVIHQQHRHTTTCKRKSKQGTVCRFKIPYPPMKNTCVLTPFAKEYPVSKRRIGAERLQLIKAFLEEKKSNLPSETFDEFLQRFCLDEDQYIEAIRCTISRPTIFLKRDLQSCFTNAYIPVLAKVWKSNMDVQVIIDPFGAARYIASYMTKSSGGVSRLMKETSEQIQAGNFTLLDRMRKIANTFLNSVEISAQEASYGILQIPLTKSSRDCIFIPTGPPDERIVFAKTTDALQALEPDSTDVAVKGLLDHYQNRPDQLEETCLADFTALFTFSTSMRIKVVEHVEDGIADEESQETLPTWYQLRDQSGYIRRRKFPRVIRYRKYGKVEDPTNYYRECLMLYVPWRNEETDVLNIDHELIYQNNRELIEQTRARFNLLETDSLEHYVDELSSPEDECDIDPNFEAMDDFRDQADLCNEFLGENAKLEPAERIPVTSLISDSEFVTLIEQLNDKQVQYVAHVLDSLIRKEVINEFVYGGAGVGKSKLIDALVQSVVRLLQSNQRSKDADLGTCKVLVGAPTGMAAFNIRGATLHSLFMLPLNQFRGGLPKLSDDKCNTMAAALRDCKLLIIDEISMVSCDQLYHISSRLKQIFKTNEDFGGLNVIVVGDLRQLKPVCASPVYSNVKTDFGEIVGNPLWKKFQSYELDEIMRQKDDKVFAEALNRLARGCMTADDVLLFKTREVSKCGVPTERCVKLYKDNNRVSMYNEQVLGSIVGEKCMSDAQDICQGKGAGACRDAMLKHANELKTAETIGLPAKLKLVVSANYMITNNLEVKDGLVNGSLGTLAKITYGTRSDGSKKPIIAWLQFKDDTIGESRIKKNKQIVLRENAAGLVPIMFEQKVIMTWHAKDAQCLRRQFPMVPAEAMTVHKSQGSSHDTIIVNVEKLTRQGLYVACSRARTLAGLYIEGEFKAPTCFPNDPIEVELLRLKTKEVVSCKYIDAVKYILTVTCRKYNIKDQEQAITVHSDVHVDNVTDNTVIRVKEVSPIDDKETETESDVSVHVNQAELVRRVGPINIFQVDLNSLDEGEWLSDAIVDGFLGLLKESSQTKTLYNFGYHFYSFLNRNPTNGFLLRNPYTTETNHDVLTFPICENNHWRVVIATRDTRTVETYNSIEITNEDITYEETVCGFLNTVNLRNNVGVTWTTPRRRTRVSKQRNGYDCGIFVCRYVESILSGTSCIFSSMEGYRSKLRRNIISGGVS